MGRFYQLQRKFQEQEAAGDHAGNIGTPDIQNAEIVDGKGQELKRRTMCLST